MKTLQLTLTFLVLLCMISCSPYHALEAPIYYTPDIHNIPLITEKGELNINRSISFNESDDINDLDVIDALELLIGIQAQASYGITDHFAIKASGAILSKDNDSRRFIEFGSGYFTKITKHGVFECYGILGTGSVKNRFSVVRTSYVNNSTNFYRIGVQPSLGIKSDHFSIAISSGFTRLKYFNIEGEETQYLEDHTSHFLIEPAIMIRTGFKACQLQLQYGRNFNITNPDFGQDDSYLSVGVNVNIKNVGVKRR